MSNESGNTKPLLTVAIATKDRELYCIEAIKSILAYNDDRIEITVADNSKTDTVKKYVSALNYPNIKYDYDPGPLSSIDNFNRCFELATGEYIIMIGDDDSITSHTIGIALWMKNNNVESVSSSRYVDYYWPNPNIETLKKGKLNIPKYSGTVAIYNNDQNLKALLKNGIIGYLSYNLPKVYHGIIKMSCMDKVKSITGHYFGALSPDIYAAVTLSCIIDKNYVADFPFSIAGICPTSTSFVATTGGHSGDLKNAPHLKNRGIYEWDSLIPKYYSVETLWAESALKALKEIGKANYLQFFNRYFMYIYGIKQNKKYIYKLAVEETGKARKLTRVPWVPFNIGMGVTALRIIMRALVARMKQNVPVEKKEFSDVPDIKNAEQTLEQTIQQVEKFFLK
jgi:glycosyltransferase involved in cell wall biosynthesis